MFLIAHIWFCIQVVHVSRRDDLWEAICTRSLAVGERNRKKNDVGEAVHACPNMWLCITARMIAFLLQSVTV